MLPRFFALLLLPVCLGLSAQTAAVSHPPAPAVPAQPAVPAVAPGTLPPQPAAKPAAPPKAQPTQPAQAQAHAPQATSSASRKAHPQRKGDARKAPAGKKKPKPARPHKRP